ncbi:FAD:protein FMN transferase [Aeromonas schubertii]|uniref:FAD:protein FMN transferase n=1 Tax=Aeromonas schubertii TaxID=652 RepID=UPI001CC74C39|nr:FAD:protein FMN transferase [Aeromonas schubertii]MBZ6074344.1 FAD:protein FMN transferase [Aeromonas schubertii]
MFRTLLLILPLILLQACQPKPEMTRIEGRTMGTFYAVTLADPFPGGERALQRRVDALLLEINREISTYDPDSVISRFNRAQDTRPHPIPERMAKIVAQGIEAGERTRGQLDVTVGPLVNLWGFGPDKRPNKTPDEQAIAAARERVGIDKLEQSRGSDGQPLLAKRRPDLYLDLSTLGEGAGSDAIAELLEQAGVHNYLIEIAGAVRSQGHNPKGKPWRVAIVDPSDQPGAFQAVVTPKGMAVSTAGSYRNYYERDGVRYSHIIDPVTGHPISHKLVSATVILPSALEADAYDTALMVMGPEKAMAYARDHRLAAFLVIKTPQGFASRHTPEFEPYLAK